MKEPVQRADAERSDRQPFDALHQRLLELATASRRRASTSRTAAVQPPQRERERARREASSHCDVVDRDDERLALRSAGCSTSRTATASAR